MKPRIDNHDKLVLRRRTDIDDLVRAIRVVNQYFGSLPNLPVRVLTNAMHQRTNSLKKLTAKEEP